MESRQPTNKKFSKKTTPGCIENDLSSYVPAPINSFYKNTNKKQSKLYVVEEKQTNKYEFWYLIKARN